MTRQSSLDPVCMVNPIEYVGKKDLAECLKLTSGGSLTFANRDILDFTVEHGTRCYLIDLRQVTKNARRLTESFKIYPGKFRPFYAVKANFSQSIVHRIVQEGFGFEVTNVHELLFAARSLNQKGARARPVRIVCNGVSKHHVQAPQEKSLIEIAFDLQSKKDHDVIVNLSSMEEIRCATKVAQRMGGGLRVGVRVNPAIKIETSEDLATGAGYSRFGIPIDLLEDVVKEIRDQKGLMTIAQLHFHIGSQISDIEAVVGNVIQGKRTHAEVPTICSKAIDLEKKLGLHVDQLNIGGGIAVKYVKTAPRDRKEYGEFWPNYDAEDYARKVTSVIREMYDKEGIDYPDLCVEPGRWLTANTTALLLTVTDVFNVPSGYDNALKGATKWIITNGSAVTDAHDIVLLRQWFEILNASKIVKPLDDSYNIGGIACDSGDVFAWGRDRTGPRMLPRTERGDILVVLDVGAYQQALASNYNMIPDAHAYKIGR